MGAGVIDTLNRCGSSRYRASTAPSRSSPYSVRQAECSQVYTMSIPLPDRRDSVFATIATG